jgi:hypothetical protein
VANKKLFPDTQALPPKAPKIKASKWKKRVATPGPAGEPTTRAEPTHEASEPVVESMPAAEASKTNPRVKKTGKPKAAKPKKEGLSMIEAAKKVLADKGEPMTCRDMIDAMAKAGYWKSPGGLTPHNTLYSSILRLIQRDGKNAAFKKSDRGMFTLNPSATA